MSGQMWSTRYRREADSWLGLTPVPSTQSEARHTRTIFVAGSGHSGSTLLDMLLGGHPLVTSLGEANRLYFSANNDTPADRCTCGRRVSDCPFWQAVEVAASTLLAMSSSEPIFKRLAVVDPRTTLLREPSGEFRKAPPGERYPFRSRLHEGLMLIGSTKIRRVVAKGFPEVDLHRRVAVNLNFLYDAVRLATGRPVVVDSTKTPGYLKGMWMERTAPVSLVTVLRDGRAVCASRIRREQSSMSEAARVWVREHIRRRAIMVSIPASARLNVRYEDLCSNPEATLRRLCTSLSLDFSASMLEFRQDKHNLGGNPMRFRSNERTIVLDTRWSQELSASQLREFNRIAGWLNRSLGYR